MGGRQLGVTSVTALIFFVDYADFVLEQVPLFFKSEETESLRLFALSHNVVITIHFERSHMLDTLRAPLGTLRA